MRKSRHTGAGAGASCCVCNLLAALTPDDPKGPLTPCLRLHPLSWPALLRPQRLPLLQERRCHRLLSIHVPAEGRAGRSPGPKPDQEPGGAAPQVSKGLGGSGGRLGGAEEGVPRLPFVGPGPTLAVLGRGLGGGRGPGVPSYTVGPAQGQQGSTREAGLRDGSGGTGARRPWDGP